MTPRSSARRRVLFVTTQPPWPADRGARLRDYALLRQVAEVHDVTVLFSAAAAEGETAARHLQALGMQVEWVPDTPRHLLSRLQWAARGFPMATWAWCHPLVWQRIAQLTARGLVDLVQLEHSFLAPLVTAVRTPAHVPQRVRTVLDLHNVAAVQYATYRHMEGPWWSRAAEWARAMLMRNWEAQWATKFDGVTTVSAADAQQLREAAPVAGRASVPSPVVVANGVDTEVLRPLPPATGDGILFVGRLDYRPNIDAVRWLCEDIMPIVRRTRPAATLVVAGDGASDALRACAGPGVTFVGRVDDVVPLYHAARVAVAPLRAGGGTKLKVLEAMALGRPVVATATACTGLTVRAGEHLLIEDDPALFAEAVIRLLQDATYGAQLTQAARALVEAQYAWTQSGSALLALYDTLGPA